MVKPKVYADFHNADAKGRLRLNCVGTIEDLARQGITLREGMPLTFYSALQRRRLAKPADPAAAPDRGRIPAFPRSFGGDHSVSRMTATLSPASARAKVCSTSTRPEWAA
jgi:hypothetical protein